MPKYRLSQKSLKNLEYVHEDLCLIVHRAIDITDCDFMVFEGLRTVERQKLLVKSGASRTMRSRHLTGHAVDLVPVLNGEPRWDWPLCYRVANAVRVAAQEYHTPVVWGGVWDRCLNGLEKELDDEVSDYIFRCRHDNIKPFVDGPHYELPRESYPAS